MKKRCPSRAKTTEQPEPACPRCHLRGEHVCLVGDATARNVGNSQWWAKRRDGHAHGKYSDAEAT